MTKLIHVLDDIMYKITMAFSSQPLCKMCLLCLYSDVIHLKISINSFLYFTSGSNLAHFKLACNPESVMIT